MAVVRCVLSRVVVAVSLAGTTHLNSVQDAATEGGSEKVFPCPVCGAKSGVSVSEVQPREFMEYLAHMGRGRG